ncbi:MAG: alpha-amylase family glycosyl hydrolase [Chloroflexota bacterium]
MRKLGLLLLFAVLAMALAAPVMAQEESPVDPVEAPENAWWNDRVFYEIFVRSFYDTNGDGIGDIRGIIEKLDYLNDGDPTTTDDLGITGIWLMPINPSPSYHGYDVTDYTAINPEYGTMEDFRELLAEAEARGIAIIIDLVVNHASVEHPWFVSSAQDPDGPYGDWFVWAEEDPGFRGPDSQVVWHPRDGRYYYGVFWSGMPDFNYDSPEATQMMFDIADFWLEDVGVAGFRLDAIKHIVEEGSIQENTLSTRAWLADFRANAVEANPDVLLVGEVWSSSTMAAPYTDTAVDIVFEFDLAESILQAASFGVSSSVRNQMDTMLSLYPSNQYATFLTNHDQNRVMSQLRGDVNAAKAAASIYLTLPGVPFIYYGEEIGMTGTKPDPEIRTPMQWGDGSGPGVGFTVARPWAPVNPDWQDGVTVAAQTDDPDSLLNHYRDLVQLRNAVPALRRGDYTHVDGGQGSVFSFLRRTEDQTVLVVINLRDRENENYTLSVENADLAPVTGASAIFGAAGDLPTPEIDSLGGFSDYRPLDVLPPLATLVIELETAE